MANKKGKNKPAGISDELTAETLSETPVIVYAVKGSAVWPVNAADKTRIAGLEKDGFEMRTEKPAWH